MSTTPITPQVAPVVGFAKAPFEPLADVFARAVAVQGRGVATLSMYWRGTHVVDLTGGVSSHPAPLHLLFSVTKAVSAVAVHLLVQDGELDLDEPLFLTWPELDKSSTRAITLRMVLSHRSGLASLDRFLRLEELLAHEDDVAIGVQEPYWEPDTAHGYHAFTFGTLLQGTVRRRLGRTVGEVVAERISRPLGLDLWVGTPESEFCRIARLEYEAPWSTPERALWEAKSKIPASSSARLAARQDIYNDPAVWASDWPSTSGVGSARALAALMASTLDGTLLQPPTLREMTATAARGPDKVLGIETHYGLGMELPFPQLPFLGPHSFGHEAAGGSAAFADSQYEVAVGWTTSVHPSMAGASSPFLSLLPSIRHCLVASREAV